MTASAYSNRLPASTILKAGSAAVLAAIVANIAARFLLGLVVPLTPGFPPFSYGAIIFFTVLGTLVGVLLLWIINRRAANPLKSFNRIAFAALVLSVVPNLIAYANPAAAPMGGIGSDYLILIFFHLVAGAAFLGTINQVARQV